MIFATASAIRFFTIGTAFWATRSQIVQAWTPPDRDLSPSDFIKASTIAGGITGGLSALVFRGRSNYLPATFMFSLFGYAGQTAYNSYLTRGSQTELEPKVGFWKRMSEKAWSPVTVMSDDEYAELLRKKMMRVDVEILILDDRIEALKKEQQALNAEETASASSNT